MKISLSNIAYVNQQYGSTDNGELQDVNVVVEKIGSQLGAVEEVINISSRYDGVVVAKVVACQDHPDADKLHVCKIDDGGVTDGVTRDEQGYVEVVCGAPNVREGLLVAWLPPGATVPSSIDKEPFIIKARELRGVVSNGMLASPKELAISDDHGGILEIDEPDAKPGQPLKSLYGLDDTVVDIENKMFTHRPDCFGQLGVAREIAGIQQIPFKSPDWYLEPEAISHQPSTISYSVDNQVPELCPRYMLIGLDNITIQPSPVWLQAYLSRIGVRPINNIVDVTNYMMLLTGQPLHAFDYDKVAQNSSTHIVIRNPKKGEKMTLLDGKPIEPRADAILICDQDKPIALGGMMGGNNSEIDDKTTRILIECANFDMYNIRRSSMEHGIFTDAVTRFTKGQSPWQCPAVLYKAVNMIQELCPEAVVAGDAVDVFPVAPVQPTITVSASFINQRLGLELSAEVMQQLLTNVEMDVQLDGEELVVTAPFWRTDIDIPEDIVEEVGRLYGYDQLPLVLPLRDLTPPDRNAFFDLKSELRRTLAAAGANELLTYSFVHGNLLDKVGQDREQAFQLSNALSPDLQYYRLSLTPSLLDKVHANVKAGYDQFALFEMGKTHRKGDVDPGDPTVPAEQDTLSLVVTASGKSTDQFGGAAYYLAKKYLMELWQSLQLGGFVNFELLAEIDLSAEPWLQQLVAPYEPTRSAIVRDGGKQIWGVVGEFKPAVSRTLKLPDYTAGFELNLKLFLTVDQQAVYQPLPRFPKVEQDITLKVPTDIAYTGLAELVRDELDSAKPEHSLATLMPIDIYQKDDDYKHITFRLSIASYERTLTTEEINKLLDKIAGTAHSVLSAIRI